jgi:restriction system protein
VIPALGYREVVHTGQTRDRGADLLAIDPEGERVVVQCKRLALTSKVGSSTVRNLIGALPLHNATTALLVTTSTFTAEAHHAANVAGIRLLDGSQLVDAARSASVLPAQQVPQPAPAAVDSSAGEGVMAEPVAPASWYADPHGGGHLRYWDGTAWTSHTHPAPPPASPT